MSDRRARSSLRWIVVPAALLCAAAMTGCSSAKQSAGSSTSTTGATTTTGPGSSKSTTTVATAPTTTTTVPGCSGSNYALSLLGSQGAAGTFELTLGFRNTSAATCSLSGYPGLQLIDASGHSIATTTVPGGGYSFTNFAPATVSMGRGAVAYFNVAYSDVPTGSESSCPTAAALQAIAPNTTTPLQVSGTFNVCNRGTLTVSPVFGSGSPHTQTTAPPSP